MIADVAVSEVQQILGWRSDKATEILRALQYAQTEREKPNLTIPWFLRQTKTITTAVNDTSYSLPSGYIQDSDEREGNLYMYSSTSLLERSRTIFLHKMSWKDFQEKFFGVWPDVDSDSTALADTTNTVASGVPNFYALRDTLVYVGPTPNAIYTINWDCFAADATPTLGQENRWLLNAPWVLIGDAASKLAADLGNAQAFSTAQGILSKAQDNLFKATIRRQEAGRKRSMGSRL